MNNKPITNIYLDKNTDNLCVDVNEIIYNILNPIYYFNSKHIIYNKNDLNKIFNNLQFKKTLFLDISNSKNVLEVLIRLNLEVFINNSITIVTIIKANILEALRTLNLNIEVEYVPKTIQLDDCEVEIEEELAVIIFNNRKGENYEH